MADTTISYPGDGVQRDFPVPFPYLDKTHVKVLVNGVAATFSWFTDTTVRLATAPPIGAVVRVYRDTPTDTRIVEFQNGSAFSDEQLNIAVQQCFFISQEAADKISGTNLPLIEAERVAAEAAADAAEAERVAAQAARVAADAAADDAEVAAANAAVAVQSALAAQVTAAQTARTGAEAARDAAVAAAGSVDGTAYLRKDDNLNSVADKAAARLNLGAQASLGFTPVQQGGGANMSANKVRLGWDGFGLLAQVDSTPLGALWSDYSAAKSLAASGYQKLPSGLIIQWGRYTGATADASLTFPVAFPTACYAVTATPVDTTRTATNNFVALSTASISTTGFNFLRRWGTVGIATDTTDFTWIAIGR